MSLLMVLGTSPPPLPLVEVLDMLQDTFSLLKVIYTLSIREVQDTSPLLEVLDTLSLLEVFDTLQLLKVLDLL